jgi:hypothetical protein
MSVGRIGTRAAVLMATLFALGVFGVSVASAGPPTSCTGPIGEVTINGNVSAGPGCVLAGTEVKGNVIVNPGGSLRTEPLARPTTITGNLIADEASAIELEEAFVDGNVQVNGTSTVDIRGGTVNGNIQITDGQANLLVEFANVGKNLQVQNNISGTGGFGFLAVFADNVGGNLQVNNNTVAGFVGPNRVQVFGNSVGSNLELMNNTSSGNEVFENTVTKNLNCQNNEPPPINSGLANTAKKKLGQCATL